MASGSYRHNPVSEANSQPKSSSFLVSFLHRREASTGKNLPPTPPTPPAREELGSLDDAMVGQFVRNNPGALGEVQLNHQESAPRSPRKSRDERRDDVRSGGKSPTKSTLGKFSFRSNGDKEMRMAKSRDASPQKPKKTKSGTNLAGLLSRPKSLKNLYKLATEEENRAKGKENMTPDGTPNNERPPPIFAQFTSDKSLGQENRPENTPVRAARERPQSFQVPRPQNDLSQSSSPSKTNGRSARPMSMHPDQTPRNKGIFGHGRSKSTVTTPGNALPELQINPEEIDQQLEALLDRRNIPENQRYKMRNLNNTIKLEFIRQDYAEMQAARSDRSGTTGTTGSATSTEQAISSDPNSPDEDEDRPKRSRGKSFTFSRGKKDNSSPTKKSKAEGTLGRHFRGRSTDSIASESRPTSSASIVGSSFLSKIKAQQGPSDYVAYLRKVQQPQLVEVGKLHKLRLLLRNETVAWIEDFIQQGGMQEIVGLLNRIMEVEWREEHEDALLNENLLCLKGLTTTAKAMEYLDAVQADLFPKLLHMLFDPERKGPSEFTTRNIITSVLLTYIESASPVERVIRAKNVLAHLRDKEPDEGERPLPFVMEMRQERPYRMWCREVVSVTKEVFWIFLHNLNVVALASDKAAQSSGYFSNDEDRDGPFGYLLRNFPQERPPVPAAPYVGGVEWDATNYLASHLDLMNAIIACTPTKYERNKLRGEFRISGWERCLGGSLRICKEKFYGSVHVALRTWVAAAAADGWDVKDVRFGPPPESRSPKKTGGGQKPKVEAAPKLDMPRLDFGDKPQTQDAWL